MENEKMKKIIFELLENEKMKIWIFELFENEKSKNQLLIFRCFHPLDSNPQTQTPIIETTRLEPLDLNP